MRKRFILGLLLVCGVAGANESVSLDTVYLDPQDQASLQRGARLFVNYCFGCHSAVAMRYSKLKVIGLTEDQIKQYLVPAGGKVGDTMTIAMDKKEAKAWFGVTPPDLSVIARSRSADWIYTYLRSFYVDSTRATGWNNLVFPNVGMPHVLWQLQGKQVLKEEKTTGDEPSHGKKLVLVSPGTLSVPEFDRAVTDLVNYLVFMSEPGKHDRQVLGFFVMLFLVWFFFLALALKKEYWKDIH